MWVEDWLCAAGLDLGLHDLFLKERVTAKRAN
jgi:hypothetical protein